MQMKFKRRFEAAHRLIEGENAGSLCSQPHGHTWFVTVTVEFKSPRCLNGTTNTMIPFEKAKKKWHQWIDNYVDHSFMYNAKDPLLTFMQKENPAGRHLVFLGDPTTEAVAVCFKSKFQCFLEEIHPDLVCSHILIEETQTNSIGFSGVPKEYLPTEAHWWSRSDFSINDL